MPKLLPAHFPLEGNEAFYEAGTRTSYVLRDEPLKLAKQTFLYVEEEEIEAPQGLEVKFVRPPLLHRYDALGLPRGTYSLVDSDLGRGYVRITDVDKPPGSTQSRVSAGLAAQKTAARFISGKAQEAGINLKLESMAGQSSQAADLFFIGEGEIQVEVKGTANPYAPIVLFDKSVRRDQSRPEIDQAADILIDGLELPVEKGEGSFIRAIDYCRAEDPSIGLAEDNVGVKSGRLAQSLFSQGRKVVRGGLRYLRQHFRHQGDHYLAVVNRPSAETLLWHTGNGPNLLKAPPLSAPIGFGLVNYGSGYKGSTRVGVAARFDIRK